MNSIVLLMILTLVRSDALAEESLVQPFVSEVKLNEFIELLPQKGHHFNLEAPQKCAGFGFLVKTPRKIRCQMKETGRQEVLVSVCDDKKTFCRQEKILFTVKANGFWSGIWSKLFSPVRYRPRQESHSKPGWISNDPEKALIQAKKQKKLLFIDFFGVWCPPCNALDEFVFPTDIFKKAAKEYVLVAIDVDSDVAWKWREHFGVRFYPTLIVANENLEEIGRIVGFQEKGKLASWLIKQKALPPIVELQKKNKLAVEEKIRIGKWHNMRGEFAKAISILQEKSSPEMERLFWNASLSLASKNDNDSDSERILKLLIKKFEADDDYFQWVIRLFDFDPDLSKSLARKIQTRYENLMQKHKDNLFEQSNLAYYYGTYLERIGKKSAAKEQFVKGAEVSRKLVAMSALEKPRGPNQDLAYFLRKSGKLNEAIELYANLAKDYPTEFTFHYGLAASLKRKKEWKQAAVAVEKALEYSYGDNWLKTVHLQAEILLGLEQKQKAKKAIMDALASIDVQQSTKLRQQHYILQMRKLLARVDVPKKAKNSHSAR